MPKYLALTPQQAAEVKQFGAEPSEYVYEEESGEAVPKAEVPMTLTEQIGAGLKSFIPGVTDTILAAPTLIGQTGDLVRQAQGTYDPYDRSDITQGTQAIKDYIVDTVGAPDPRAHWLSTGIGRGAGNLLSFMAGGGLARKGASFAMRKAGEEAAKKAAERAAKYTVAGLGGTLMGSSTVEREMDRQQDVGVQDPLKTAAKGLISGIGGGYIEQKLGAGLLLRNLLSPTKRLGSRLGQAILPGFAGGASTEGLQQGLENELVTEGSLQLGDPNYDPVRAAIVGGIVQGGSAMALSGGRKPAAPQEGADPAAQPAEQAAGMVGLRTGRVKPSATPEDTQGAPMYEPTPGVAEAMLKAGVNWDPPIKTPVDAAYKKLAEKGVIVTPEDIHQLYNIWGGKAENAKAVESAANGIYSRNVMNDVQKPKSTLDIVNAQLAVREKYDSTRGNLQKKLADLDSKDEKLQKSITENPTAIGTITAANAELARNAAQRKNYEAMLGELDNQEMLELSAEQPVLPTRGMESPRVPIAALPAAGTTDTYSGAPGRPLGPAIPTRDAVPTAGEQQVAQTMQDYAADAGTVGLSMPMDPARAKALQEQRAQQEGEQGSPFGDAEARYSGLPLHWKAYIKGGVDRLVKNPDGSLKRFYHGTYKKFPDSAIGFKRGSEKSKAASVFVTDNEEAAKLFGDRVVPVYLEEGAYTKRPHSYNIFDAGRADESFDEYQVDDLTAIVPAVKEGSTFGEQTRYSGIPWKEFMQLARRGREGLHAMRPRYSGYQPASPVDAANNLDLFKEGSAVQDVVYHVTTAPMGIKNDIFDVGANKDELGAHFGTLDTIGNLKRRHKSVIKQEDAQVYPVHLSIQNPVWLPDIFPLSDWSRDIQSAKANLDAAGTPIDAQNLIIDWLQRKAEGTVDSTQDLRIGLQKLGYDGARYVNAAEGGGESWIAFNPRQIKSATGNVGTFDEKNPSIMYSGIPPAQLKWVDDLFKSLGLKNLGNFDPAYAMSKSVTSRMATRGPSGGLVKWLFADMTREKQKIANVLMEMTEPFREFVSSENGIKWINRASTDETWDDYSGLTPEEIPAAEAYANWWRDVRELITDRGVYVAVIDPKTGEISYRPGKELPGYSAHAVGDQVYEVAGDANRKAEWAQMQEDFIRNWANDFGEGTQEMARTAIANILGVKGMETGPGGEPLFGPVSLPHGMTLPESWRDKRPADSLNRYIRRVSQHLAWAEKVQYNPAARRVFNIKADPMGVDTSKTDPTTWAEAPEAWAYAVREGKRVRADWALEADEKNPPDEPIDFAGDSANMNALLSSFKQASSPNPNLQAFSSAASAALMQAPTGSRDVGMSLVRAAQYAGPSAALRSSMDYIMNIPAKIQEARRAGAMPGDLLEPEMTANAKALAKGLMRSARTMRKWSGREFLDNTGRVIIYDAVKSVILEGNGDHLVQEFGPAYTEGMSKEEIASQTAAVLSHRASNVSDAGSLPAGMLPQSGGLSAPLSLMRWSVAQYNTFAEDVVNPMLDGKGELGMKRFLTLMLGSIVAGSVINGLLDDLLKRKPDHLTWGEWLNVYNDPKVDKATKAKEFAYAASSRAQVMGALGWVGDYLVAPATRELAGGTRWASQTDMQYPAWIVGSQIYRTIASYYNAVSNKRTDGRDFLDFLMEMLKINQNVRVAHGAIKAMQGAEKKGLRDQSVVERVYDVNSATGRSAGLETGVGPMFRSDPFNFTRQAMANDDLGKLEGFLEEERRKTGNVPVLDEWSQDRRYYNALERLIGEEEAKKRREVDRKMDQEVRKKNREIRRLSR